MINTERQQRLRLYYLMYHSFILAHLVCVLMYFRLRTEQQSKLYGSIVIFYLDSDSSTQDSLVPLNNCALYRVKAVLITTKALGMLLR